MSTQKEMKFSDKQKFDLLEQVQREPMLWDRQCDAFKMRDAKNDKWAEIATAVGYESGKKAADAWQVLRDEYIKQRKRQSGQGAKITWKFFDSMSFYSAACDPRPGQSTTLVLQQSGVKGEPSGSRQLLEEAFEVDEDIDDDSVLGEFGASPSTPGGAPGKKRKLSVEMQILKSLERSQKELEATMTEENDENVAFGKSIGLSLQKLPAHQANWARMQMSTILYQAQCWQTPQPPTTTQNPSGALQELHYNNENEDDILFPTQPSLLAKY